MSTPVTYLRKGRMKRATGTIVDRYSSTVMKVQPKHVGWGFIPVTREEIEAGQEKPPIVRREKPEMAEAPEDLKPKRVRRPKAPPVPRWKQLVADARKLQVDFPMMPGLPLITELADELEAAQTIFQQKA